MNAGALVFCLLDAEGDYTPEGYRLLDAAQAGDYELKLWQGTKHVDGKPVDFNEVSLNAVGRSFDPESQTKKFKGSIYALGHRAELLRIVANWLNRFGELYVGSHDPKKLGFYYRIFKKYLPRLKVTEPYPPFDESEGEPDYFHVGASRSVIESILQEAADDVDAQRYVNELPDTMSQAVDAANKMFARVVESGAVNEDNFGEMAESVVNEIVDKFNLTTGDELVDIRTFNTILHHLLKHVDRFWPKSDAE